MNRAFLLSSIVVALASGIVVAARAPMFIGPWSIWEEVVPAVLILAPYAATAIALLLAGVAFVMRRLGAKWGRGLSDGPWISAGALVAGSMFLLGPEGGFHHMIGLGVLRYAIIDCESPAAHPPIPFGHCEIRSSPVLLAVTLAVWVTGVLLLNRVLRRRSARRA